MKVTRKAVSRRPRAADTSTPGLTSVSLRVRDAQRGVAYSPSEPLAEQAAAAVPQSGRGRSARGLVAPPRRRRAPRVGQAVETSWAQRYDVIDTWGVLLSELYVHLLVKRALYGYDVVRALEALRRQVPLLTHEEFHRELSGVINRLRDAHTQHVNASVPSGLVARLPFLVESYGSYSAPRFVVTKVTAELVNDRHFIHVTNIGNLDFYDCHKYP